MSRLFKVTSVRKDSKEPLCVYVAASDVGEAWDRANKTGIKPTNIELLAFSDPELWQGERVCEFIPDGDSREIERLRYIVARYTSLVSLDVTKTVQRNVDALYPLD